MPSSSSARPRKSFLDIYKKGGDGSHADVVVVDPPRKGCDAGASGHSGPHGAGTYRLRELRPGNPG